MQITRSANSEKLLSRCLKHGQTGSRIRAGKDGHFHFLYPGCCRARAQGVGHVCTLEWMTCEIQVFHLGSIYHLTTPSVTTERSAAVWFVAMYVCTAHY